MSDRKVDFVFDVVFLVNVNSKGWILDRVCKELSSHPEIHAKIIYMPTNGIIRQPVPSAKAYFFSHFEIAMNIASRAIFADRPKFVYFTHPDPSRNINMPKLIDTLNSCEITYAMNARDQRWLEVMGVAKNKISKMVGGVDTEVFSLAKRSFHGGRPIIGVVSAFYRRKNPELLLELVRENPQWDFHLVAPGQDHTDNKGLLWKNWDGFGGLQRLDNFSIHELPYESYPAAFKRFDAYISLSTMEGGPIPLLECLASGIPCVCTDTGFAPDVLDSSTNGRVVPTDASSRQVAQAIRDVLKLDPEAVRRSVQPFTWSSMADTFRKDFAHGMSLSEEVSFVKGSGADRHLGFGWHAIESLGVWSCSEKACLEFEVTDPEVDSTVFLSLVIIGKSIEHSEIEISINGGQPTHTFLLNRNKTTEVAVRIPAGTFHDGPNEMGIEVEKLVCAQEFNERDTRLLGARLFSMRRVVDTPVPDEAVPFRLARPVEAEEPCNA